MLLNGNALFATRTCDCDVLKITKKWNSLRKKQFSWGWILALAHPRGNI